MDWAKINVLLEIVHKSAGVPEANFIRQEAISALKLINDIASPKATVAVSPAAVPVEPELPLTKERRAL